MVDNQLRNAEAAFVIVLGASDWPSISGVDASAAFTNTAQRLYRYCTHMRGLDLSPDDILWLFDSPTNVIEQVDRINEFLTDRFTQVGVSNRGQGATIFVAYIGHGDFVGRHQAYCLLLRDTHDPDRASTSLRVESLAHVLRRCAPDSFRVVILDACFAASAVGDFQTTLETVERQRLSEALSGPDRQGVALLCAASSKKVARLLSSQQFTMFGAALLDVLEKGDPDERGPMSLDRVCVLTQRILEHVEDAPHPEIHAPDQRVGDLIRTPLFPNPFQHDSVSHRSPYNYLVPSVPDRRVSSPTKLESGPEGDANGPNLRRRSLIIVGLLVISASAWLFVKGWKPPLSTSTEMPQPSSNLPATISKADLFNYDANGSLRPVQVRRIDNGGVDVTWSGSQDPRLNHYAVTIIAKTPVDYAFSLPLEAGFVETRTRTYPILELNKLLQNDGSAERVGGEEIWRVCIDAMKDTPLNVDIIPYVIPGSRACSEDFRVTN